MKMALAALAQGNGFLSALDAADRTIARLWLVRAEASSRPGVAKCGSSSRSTIPPAASAPEQAANG
jgi:hypothetical protein